MGSRAWIRKSDEVRQVLSEQNPDILVIAEANLHVETQQKLKKQLKDIKLITNKIPAHRNIHRLIVLVKDGLQIVIRDDIMDENITSIWIEIPRRGEKKLLLGAVYREQSITGIPKPNNSDEINQQIRRWKHLLQQWSRVGVSNDTYVVGDTNLDFHRWHNPRQACRQMVEDTKTDH